MNAEPAVEMEEPKEPNPPTDKSDPTVELPTAETPPEQKTLPWVEISEPRASVELTETESEKQPASATDREPAADTSPPTLRVEPIN